MPQQKLSKNLPKRCVNEHLKDRRKRSWSRGQKRKEQRKRAQKVAEAANRQRRETGQLTPWEQAQVKSAKTVLKIATEDQVQVVSPDTSYPHIRLRLDRFLGEKGITIDYLDMIHRRWTYLGKMIQKGVR